MKPLLLCLAIIVNFITVAQEPLKVVEVFPAPNAQNVKSCGENGILLKIKFNKPCGNSFHKSMLKCSESSFRINNLQVIENGYALVLKTNIVATMNDLFIPGTTYTFTIDTTFQYNGQKLNEPYIWSFTTSSPVELDSTQVSNHFKKIYDNEFSLNVPFPFFGRIEYSNHPSWFSTAFIENNLYQIVLYSDGSYWAKNDYKHVNEGKVKVAMVFVDYHNTNFLDLLNDEWKKAQDSIINGFNQYTQKLFDNSAFSFEITNIYTEIEDFKDRPYTIAYENVIGILNQKLGIQFFSEFDLLVVLHLDPENPAGGAGWLHMIYTGHFFERGTNLHEYNVSDLYSIAEVIFYHELAHCWGWEHANQWHIQNPTISPFIVHPGLFGWVDTNNDGHAEAQGINPYGMDLADDIFFNQFVDSVSVSPEYFNTRSKIQVKLHSNHSWKIKNIKIVYGSNSSEFDWAYHYETREIEFYNAELTKQIDLSDFYWGSSINSMGGEFGNFYFRFILTTNDNKVIRSPIKRIRNSPNYNQMFVTISQNLHELACDPIYSAYEWFNQDGIIEGETNEKLKVQKNGSYHLEVINSNGYRLVSNTINVLLTQSSIFEDSTTSFLLYPNPSNGQFELQSSMPIKDEMFLRITNISGKTIEEKIINSGQYPLIERFNLIDLSKGLYFLSISTDKILVTKKIILN